MCVVAKTRIQDGYAKYRDVWRGFVVLGVVQSCHLLTRLFRETLAQSVDTSCGKCGKSCGNCDNICGSAEICADRVAETCADKVVDNAETSTDKVVDIAEKVVDIAETCAEKVVDIAETFADKVVDIAETSAEKVVDIAETIAEKVVDIAETFVEISFWKCGKMCGKPEQIMWKKLLSKERPARNQLICFILPRLCHIM